MGLFRVKTNNTPKKQLGWVFLFFFLGGGGDNASPVTSSVSQATTCVGVCVD